MNTLNATSETLAVHGDGLTWGISQPVHNFSNEQTYWPRIVCVGVGCGVALPFWFISIFHEEDL